MKDKQELWERLAHNHCDSLADWLWALHERIVALERLGYSSDPSVPYAPHPAYTVAAEWKNKYDQQKERASGLEKELGTVREQLLEKTDLLHKSTADYRAQYKRADANQAAADTLDKLRRGEVVGQDRLLHFSLPGELAKLRAERDALAAKLADLEHSKAWLMAERLEVARFCGYPLDDINEPLKNAVMGKVAELETRLADRDALAAQLADVDAARVAAEDLANANAIDVGILERRLAAYVEWDKLRGNVAIVTSDELTALRRDAAELKQRVAAEISVSSSFQNIIREIAEAAGHEQGTDIVTHVANLRRDAERWRTWAEMLGADFLKHAWTGKVDVAIATKAAKGEAK